MLKRDAFVNFILKGPKEKKAEKAADDQGPSLPDGFGDFGFSPEETQEETETEFSFARQLIEASGFGNAEYLERSEVILGNDPAAKFLPQRVYYWPKKDKRPYQTLLFELEQPGRQLLKTPLFKKLKSQEILEDAVSRLVQMSLRGFEKGGEKRTASVKSGKQNETLCIVSIQDDRLERDKPLHLVCLGTKSKKLNSLENYHIREEARLWERQLAVDHLSRLYDRHFSKLDGEKWQESFITGEERKLAQKLMDACVKKQPQKRSIEKCVVGLLEEIAKTFGLRKKKGGSRLMPFQLPKDHDIGVDPEKREKGGGQNPFEGMILRDEKSRLLGYIIYCLDQKKDADKLRKYLERNNRFHNVLVIYPDGTEAVLELWQGMKRLEGKLTKDGAAFEEEGKIVNLLSRFFVVSKAKVRNPEELAQELAYRARYLRRLALKQLQEEEKTGLLRDLYSAFKEALIHDQTEDQFADSYAQTLSYGLLSARWISKDYFASKGERFTRKKALEHFPPSSPFLRDFFKAVLKAHSEFKLSWLLDDIADLLDRTDIGKVFAFGNGDKGDLKTDPVIHFYEPFLAAYDPSLKKKRGVYYTPQPVVSFIVRSVDQILRTEFGLKDGLADTITWGEMEKQHYGLKVPNHAKKSDPFIKILDPATGTGTFLATVIDVIHETMTEKWKEQGSSLEEIKQLWLEYVPEHLLTRLYGFELMMAPYAIAHIKIGWKLYETGFRFNPKSQANIFLSNTLEPLQHASGWLEGFAPGLSHEAKAANQVKSSLLSSVIIGNPPYSKISSNLTTTARAIVDGYRYIDGIKIKERGALQFEINLQDDYVKFVRWCQQRLSNCSSGILGFITNNGYLTTPTLRGMRWSIQSTFSKISVVDLHGHLAKGEIGPDGTKEENVFDIQQGVAITLARNIQRDQRQPLLDHFDLYGIRTRKYKWLSSHVYSGPLFKKIKCSEPYYKFVPQDLSLSSEFESAYGLQQVFRSNSAGVITARDSLVLDSDPGALLSRIKAFRSDNRSSDKIYNSYNFKASKRFNLKNAQEALKNLRKLKPFIRPILHRPFDRRSVFYHGDVVWSLSRPMAEQMYPKKNIALVATRQVTRPNFEHVFISRDIIEIKACSHDRNTQIFPLYLPNRGMFKGDYNLDNIQQEFFEALSSALQLSKINSGRGNIAPGGSIGPEDILYYIYGQLHSMGYRKRYADFLKVDFPRIFPTKDLVLFSSICRFGANLVGLHLLEDDYEAASWESGKGPLRKMITPFVCKVTPEVAKAHPKYKNGNVYINKSCYFEGVPENVWAFYIGGYRVCHKWLKDRGPKKGNPGKVLTEEDITHYQKIIVALNETIRIMHEIDRVIEKHGGWLDAFITKKGED